MGQIGHTIAAVQSLIQTRWIRIAEWSPRYDITYFIQIMSAAHCKQSGNDWRAGAGSAQLSNQRQKRDGKKQLPHPQFNPDNERVVE